MKFFFNDLAWRDEIDDVQYLKSLEWGMQADHFFWHVEQRINENIQTLLVDQIVDDNYEMVIVKSDNWHDLEIQFLKKMVAKVHREVEHLICDPIGAIVWDGIREKVEDQIYNDNRWNWHD